MSWEWVTGALGDLGNMLLQALFNAGANTVEDLATQAMTGALGGISDAITGALGVDSWFSGVVETFTGNLEQSLSSVTANLTNGLNQTAQTALGISNAQQELTARLNGVTEGLLDGFNDNLAIEQSQQQQTGAVLTDYMLHFVNGKSKEMETFGAYLAQAEVDAAGGAAVLNITGTNRYYDYMMEYIEADLSFVEGRAVDLDEATYNALMDQVERNSRDFKEWFRDTVVIPIANYNAMVSAIKTGFDISSEDVKNTLGEMAKASYEYNQERLEKGEIAPGIKVDMSAGAE